MSFHIPEAQYTGYCLQAKNKEDSFAGKRAEIWDLVQTTTTFIISISL
jgi:hypothetical protein